MDLDYTRALTPARRLAPRRQPYTLSVNVTFLRLGVLVIWPYGTQESRSSDPAR
jgi:hypothetical protein